MDLLDTEPAKLADTLDWVAKQRLIDGYIERDGLDWGTRNCALSIFSITTSTWSKGLYHRLVDRGR